MLQKIKVLLFVLFSLFSSIAYSQSLWKEIPLPITGSQYTMIDFSDSVSGWIFTDNGTYVRTVDGGKTWSKDSLGAPHSVKQIKAFSKSGCWVVYSDEDFKVSILLTEDGTNWRNIPIPDSLNKVWGRLEFTSPATIWLPSMQKGIFVSTDYGQSWQRNHDSWGYGCKIDFTDPMNGYLAFWMNGVGGETYGTTLRTKNGGVDWDTVYFNSYTSHYRVKYYDAAYGYIITAWTGMDGFPHYEYLWMTNGVSAINFNTGDVRPSNVVGCLHYLSGENFVVTSAHRMKRADGDTTRYILSSGPDGNAVVAFESIPERWNWILTSGNHLYTSVDIPTAVNRNSDAHISSYSLNNYPNPFNPSTTISFGLPVRSFVTLQVFDMMGREVARLAAEELPPGMHSRTWNASGMPSGVYFYRLQAGAYTETKRLALVK